jgi:UDP-N-acetylmuramate: L-alanyl-gamma-D-glutamyl-meso-diaminopimelate ligase
VVNYNGQLYKLSVFGRHNIQNALAAVSVCMQLGISGNDGFERLTTFTGAARRLEKITEGERLTIYRDFAHAPSKLRATLNAVREAYSGYCLIACFELHTFSSLNEQFLNEYAGTMDAADEAVVYYSQHALQLKGLPLLQKDAVASHFGRQGLWVTDNKEALMSHLSDLIQKTDLPVFLLLMSSGTFDGIEWINFSEQFK